MPYIIVLLCFLLLPISSIHAQSGLIYGDEALTIDLEPLFPEPNTPFTATANDYAVPVAVAGMRWFIDGQLVTDSVNERSISYVAPQVGETMKIMLVLDLPDGKTISAEKIITPVYLDIIIEPQTRTPAFYRGRGIPSMGSTVNATAIINGNSLLPRDLIYFWQVEGVVLNGGEQRGKHVASFTMPRGQAATLRVEVRRPTGEIVARRLLSIPSVAPEIIFYETSSLYGMSQLSLTNPFPLIGSTISLHAEPYNLDLATYNNPDHLTWEIDGVDYQNPSANPYEISLAAASAGGRSLVNFHVRNTTQVLQGAESNFTITY
jgi:hypothetical protein